MANSEITHCAAGAKMGKHTIEELLQLMREKAVEKEVGNNQIVASGGIPLESIGVMQTNAPAGLGARAANAAIENAQHRLAGVDNVRSEGGIGCQQTGQEASIAIAEEERMPGAGQMFKLGVTAALEPGPKAQVFEPSVGAGDGIEINGRHVLRTSHFYSAQASVARCDLGSASKGEEGQRGQQGCVGGDAQVQRGKV